MQSKVWDKRTHTLKQLKKKETMCERELVILTKKSTRQSNGEHLSEANALLRSSTICPWLVLMGQLEGCVRKLKFG